MSAKDEWARLEDLLKRWGSRPSRRTEAREIVHSIAAAAVAEARAPLVEILRAVEWGVWKDGRRFCPSCFTVSTIYAHRGDVAVTHNAAWDHGHATHCPLAAALKETP